jgi:UPF0716 protein FxsA
VPLVLLVLIFVAVPLLELYVIIQVVGPALGAPLTIALLAADSLAGAWLMKSQGRVVWKRFNETLRAGAMPHREIVDGVLVIFGGAFLITPGFITDILGFILLIPPTRALVRRVLQRSLERRAVFTVTSAATDRMRRKPAGATDFDVEGTATEHDADDASLELPRRSGGRGAGRPQP